MKSLFFSVGLFIVTVGLSYSQDVIKLPLKQKLGAYPYKMIGLVIDRNLLVDYPHVKMKGIPPFVEDYELLVFDFQPFQGMYERFLDKNMSKKDSLFIKNANTKNLSNKKTKHFVAVFSGFHNSKRIIILDANNNYDFSDDKIFEFSKSDKVLDNDLQDNLINNEICLEYEYFENNQLRQHCFNVEIEPETPILNFSNFRTNTRKEKLAVIVRNNEHRATKVKLNGYEMDIYISSFLAEPGSYKDISFTFNKPELGIDQNNKIKKTYTQDSIVNIGGSFYKFSCNAIGDTLTILKVNQIADIPIEKQKNEFLNLVVSDINNNTFKFNDLRGKFILIDFWGTWCKPCIQSIPILKQCFGSYDHSKFEIVSIAWDNSLDKVKNFIKRDGNIKWVNLFEDNTTPPNEKLFFKLKVNKFPTFFLIDDKGNLVAREVGADDLLKIIKILDDSNLRTK